MASTIFEKGDLDVECLTVDASDCPKPLLIFTPVAKNMSYPVLMFFHGFCLRNYSYTQLLIHVSSHGYIVVAPQMYLLPPSGTEEVNSAAEVINWLPKGLPMILGQINIEPNLTKLALSGHSRGGKAAFALALGFSKPTLAVPISLLIGIDPVAGPTKCCQTKPIILTGQTGGFNLKIPVSVIGTGLGDVQRSCIRVPCAPDGLNHKEFIKESNPPYCYFVTKEYGHVDMLDDEPDFVGKLSGCLCAKGKDDKDPMRRCVGGIIVTFLKAYFDGVDDDLKAIVDDPSIAPVILDPVSFEEK